MKQTKWWSKVCVRCVSSPSFEITGSLFQSGRVYLFLKTRERKREKKKSFWKISRCPSLSSGHHHRGGSSSPRKLKKQEEEKNKTKTLLLLWSLVITAAAEAAASMCVFGERLNFLTASDVCFWTRYFLGYTWNKSTDARRVKMSEYLSTLHADRLIDMHTRSILRGFSLFLPFCAVGLSFVWRQCQVDWQTLLLLFLHSFSLLFWGPFCCFTWNCTFRHIRLTSYY